MNKLLPLLFFVGLAACQRAEQTPPAEPAASPPAAAAEMTPAAAADRLAEVLAAEPDDVKARYVYRHPKETLEFFGIEPGMTVVEGLPGQGWYTRILLPYLGSEGHLIGANYALDMWPNFPFATDEFMAEMSQWLETWPAQAEEWRGDDGATVAGFWFGSMPDDMAGTADVVFFARVLHNLARFQNAGIGSYLDAALADAYRVLKPGGIFGVVQHQARDGMPDDWASGENGYLKKQYVIEQVEAAGFEFIDETDINQNDADRPTTDDIVWRLPPTFATSRDNPELKAQYEAVGESNRMTLKFKKPD